MEVVFLHSMSAYSWLGFDNGDVIDGLCVITPEKWCGALQLARLLKCLNACTISWITALFKSPMAKRVRHTSSVLIAYTGCMGCKKSII